MTIGNKNVRIMVTISKKEKENLKKLAEENNRSVSNYVRNLILLDMKNSYRNLFYSF